MESFSAAVPWPWYELIAGLALYVVIASLVLYAGAKGWSRVLGEKQGPGGRAWAYAMPLLLPVAGFFSFCRHTWQSCSSQSLGGLLDGATGAVCLLPPVIQVGLALLVMTAVAWGMGRLALRFVSTRYVRSGLQPLEPADRERVMPLVWETAQAAGIAAPPVYRVPRGRRPDIFVLGAFRPLLAISPMLWERLDEAELRALLAHEMGHLRSKDGFWKWALLVARELTLFNPVGKGAYLQMMREREQACDDFAARVTGDPLSVASGLVRLGRLRQESKGIGREAWGPGLAFAAMPGQLSQRVERMVEAAEGRPARVLSPVLAVFVGAALAILAALC